MLGPEYLSGHKVMVTYRDVINAFRDLDLGSHSRVIVHASLSAFGEVSGGADTIVGALLTTCETVMLPTFTYRTMVIPKNGPPDNAIDYGSADEENLKTEFFHPDMPADSAMGVIAETLRLRPEAKRSSHPILSFAGVNPEQAFDLQTLEAPLAPIKWLEEYDGDVLQLGVDYTVNTSLHYAEEKAERRRFIRWALTPQGVLECPAWPGCSRGFQAIAPRLEGVARRVALGTSTVEVIPLRDLIHITVSWIHEDPRALLCDELGCPRCAATRASVRVAS
jgi:aminoglycoside 3-N-acetyltransferase